MVFFYHFNNILEPARHEPVHAVFFMTSRTELNTKTQAGDGRVPPLVEFLVFNSGLDRHGPYL